MKNDIEKLYRHRLHNLRIMVKLLRFTPFVRCLILNGSMAEGKIKLSSDIDILIIAKSGRIYTCRAAVLFWAYISSLKRSSNEKKTHAGRFCFNYFLTENFLEIPHNRGEKVDKYCAENYSKSMLLSGDKKLFDKYMRTNLRWMKKYINGTQHPQNYFTESTQKKNKSHCEEPPAGGDEAIYLNRLPCSFKSLAMTEQLLSGRFGDWLEKKMKVIQIKRIKRDPAVREYPKYIVFNDKELRFHLPERKLYD